MTDKPLNADTILSALDFDSDWLIEISNADPLQFIGKEDRLYSIMNKIQFVTSRFARVPLDEFEHDIEVMRRVRDSDPQWRDAIR
jgi:hypothetical protein